MNQRYCIDAIQQVAPEARLPAHQSVADPQPPRSNIGEQAFYEAVAKGKRYITDGDIMHVQISQRLTQPFAGSPVTLYRALRSINPSPYMFYFDFGDSQLVGASPEILVPPRGRPGHRAAHRRHAQAGRHAGEGPRRWSASS